MSEEHAIDWQKELDLEDQERIKNEENHLKTFNSLYLKHIFSSEEEIKQLLESIIDLIGGNINAIRNKQDKAAKGSIKWS